MIVYIDQNYFFRHMKRSDILIKWVGSKQRQSESILSFFPKSIKCYYEPFLGGGSMMYTLLSSDIVVDKLICSDICSPLIGIYKIIKTDPSLLLSKYEEQWRKLSENGKEYYYDLREQFNQDGDPIKFFFLTRCCWNGVVRFNSKGKFNSPLHLKRFGINPIKLKSVIINWNEQLNSRDVSFEVRDYREVVSNRGDFTYLDPPYAVKDNTVFYSGMVDYLKLWEWCRKQSGGYAISLNGFKDNADCRIPVPNDIYSSYHLIDNGLNKLDQIRGNQVVAQDSLYIK